MSLVTQQYGAVVVLRLGQENLDAALVKQLGERLLTTATESPRVIDLSDVRFVDSSGVGLLCQLTREAGRNRLALVCGDKRLRQYLERVPGERLPPRFESLLQAIATLKDAVRLDSAPEEKPALALACS